MSLQQTIDAVNMRSRSKVDKYMNKHARMSEELTFMNETSATCASKARGLEQFVQHCKDNYDESKDRYRCVTGDTRTAVETEILQLERALRGHPGSGVARQKTDWRSVGQRPFNERSAYLKSFMDNSSCAEKKLYCTWNGQEAPNKIGSTITMDYLDQGKTYLSCEAMQGTDKVVFAPRNRLREQRATHPNSKLIEWERAFEVFGNSEIYASLLNGPCDV